MRSHNTFQGICWIPISYIGSMHQGETTSITEEERQEKIYN